MSTQQQSPANPLQGKLLFPFVAPPNAGKGTQTHILSQRYQLPTFDMGSTFRAILKDGRDPQMKAELESFMNNGKLLPIDTVVKVFRKNFELLAAQHPDAKGFILDGFPRNVAQFEALDRLCKEWDARLGKVIYLQVSPETVEQRATGRRFCALDTQHLYNVNNAKLAPKHKKLSADGQVCKDAKGREIWLCDQDQAELIIRPDDEPEKVQVRLDEYAKETDPLVSRMEAAGLIASINGEESPEKVTQAIEAHLQPLLGLSPTV